VGIEYLCGNGYLQEEAWGLRDSTHDLADALNEGDLKKELFLLTDDRRDVEGQEESY
jgi:hypothetical protein